MPLMTREDQALFEILKKHDENNLMMKVEEEDFSILDNQQKEKYVADIIHLLTERTYAGAALGYKSLEDRKKEIEEANKAARAERSNPDPSFNAAGMDELYAALKKENNIEKYTYFPSKNEFKQMKLDEKIKLTEDLIEGSTERSIRGYAYDAAASILGAEQYGTKAEREKALYDAAAKALDPMLEEYQKRNRKEAKIFQYQNRDVMDKLYGNIYNAIEAGSDGARKLPSRSIFYAMEPEERINLVSKIIPEHPSDFLSGPFADNTQLIENLQDKLTATDKEFSLLTLDEWAAQDKLYGKIYTDLQALSDSKEEIPSRGEFFKMSLEEKKELVKNITPEESILDLNAGLTPKEEEKSKIIESLEAIAPKKVAPKTAPKKVDPKGDLTEIDEPAKEAKTTDTTKTVATQKSNAADTNQKPTTPRKRENSRPDNYAYIDVENGEKIALDPVRTKEGVEFHYPEDPKDNIITEKGNEKEGYRFESTQEAIDRGENITIETPCLDENGAKIPNKFEKLIFNPKTNEMLLHTVPDGHKSRLDQEWLSKFEDKTPKSQSIVRTGVSKEDLEAIERNQAQEEQSIISPAVNKIEAETTIVEPEIEVDKVDENTPKSDIETAQRLVDATVIPKLKKATTPAAPASPAAPITPSFTVRCPGQDGRDQELERNKAGHFINSSGDVVVEVEKNGKDFKVLGQGEVFIDRPRTNPEYVTREKYLEGKFEKRTDTLELYKPPAERSFSSVSTGGGISSPAITPNQPRRKQGTAYEK